MGAYAVSMNRLMASITTRGFWLLLAESRYTMRPAVDLHVEDGEVLADPGDVERAHDAALSDPVAERLVAVPLELLGQLRARPRRRSDRPTRMWTWSGASSFSRRW